jgi:hypothetical protein
MATDCDFLADVLKDHGWHSTSEILAYSINERGCGLTVHSRISDLRAKGLNIEYRRVPGERAAAHQYRLVAVRESDPDSLTAGVQAGRSPGQPAAAVGLSDALLEAGHLPNAGPVPSFREVDPQIDEPAQQLSFEVAA